VVQFLGSTSQSTFQNLNFESANLIPVPAGQYGGYVPISEAMPGWTGYISGVQTTQVLQNDFTLGAACIDILGPQWASGSTPGIIDGNYTAFLQPGSYATTSIAQTGTIPPSTESLFIDAWQPPFATPFSVSFAGNTLSLVVVSTAQSPSGQTYDVYGANVSQFGGQTGQLEFTVYPNNYNSLLLDDIEFSTNPLPVPEPGPAVLTGVGGLMFALCRRFAPKRA
jgi:hypothetical protein